MRITHYLRIFRAMLVLTALLVPTMLGAQNVTMDARNVSVQEAVTILQSQGNYTIVINADDVDLQKRISVSAKDAPLSEVLSQIFAGQNLDFSVNGNTVSVGPHKSAPAPVSLPAKMSLKGTVTDRSGEPLIGASLVVKGTNKYALSDETGAYSLDDIPVPATVTVSFVGFDDTEIALSGREASPYTIVLTSESTVLNELVVVGYGTQKRVNLTGAVSVIDGKELNARPVTNTAMALQGADPSLVLTTSSGSIDGANYSVNIRGKLSLNSGSPLILVDGPDHHQERRRGRCEDHLQRPVLLLHQYHQHRFHHQWL